MDEFKIGEFSENLGVTSDLLKHYQKMGLIVPTQREDTNYRYYRFAQAAQVHASAYYKNTGFSLREVADLLEAPSAQAVLTTLQAQIPTIDAELARLEGAKREIAALQDAARKIDASQPWEIGHEEASFVLPHATDGTFSEDPSIAVRAGEWLRQAYFVQSCQLLGAEPFMTLSPNEPLPVQWAYRISARVATARGVNTASPAIPLPAAPVLRYYQSFDLRLDTQGRAQASPHEVFTAARNTVRKLGYTATGTIIHHVLFYTQSENSRTVHSEFIIPYA